MNFMGVGFMELVVIMVVAFLVLGPGRAIDVARKSGKFLGDLRRSFSDVTDAISVEEQQGPRPKSPPPPPGVPSRPDLPDGDAPAPDGPAPGSDKP